MFSYLCNRETKETIINLNIATMKEFTFKIETTSIALARIEKAKELIANGASFNETIYGRKGNSHSVDMEVYVNGEKIALGRYDKGLTDIIKNELLEYLTAKEELVEEVVEEVVEENKTIIEINHPKGYENRTELWADSKEIAKRNKFVKLTYKENNLIVVSSGGANIRGGSYELSKLTQDQRDLTLAGLQKYMSGLEYISYSIGLIEYNVK